MLHPRPSSPLCGPSRLRHLAVCASRALTAVVSAAVLCVPAGAQQPAPQQPTPQQQPPQQQPQSPQGPQAAGSQQPPRKAQGPPPEPPPLCPSLAALNPHPPQFKETKPDPNALIDVSADRANLTQDGNIDLHGDIVVRQSEREIRAQDAHYDRAHNAFNVKGAVQFEDPLVRITGQNGRYSPTEGGDFNQADFEMRQRSARGSARTLDLSPEGILNLNGVVFTTCPRMDRSWLLRAGSLRLDTVERVGTARSAEVDFKGVPILYLPWMTFPLSNERKTGFLFPTIGSSKRNGVVLDVPFYWNIAPNADLLFSPILYSHRGVDLGGDARFLTEDQNGEVVWHFLPDDKAYYNELIQAGTPPDTASQANNNRSFVQVKDTVELPETVRLRIDATNVSDRLYFQDFGNGPEGTSTAFLLRLAKLSYADDVWRIGIEAQQYQTIDLSLRYSDGPTSPIPTPYADYEPYARAPRIYADADASAGPAGLLRYGFDSEVVDFTRSVGPTGWRVDLTPHLMIDVEDPGFFIRPSIAWRYTRYQLEDTLPGQLHSPTRELPIASFDTGLMFERTLAGNHERTLTLEPRMLYLYVPYRDQSQIPVFDTALPDLNMVELFRNNQYVGADRMSNANQITLGVTSRLLESGSGQQYLAGTLGEQYYFSQPRVFLPGETPPSSSRSDLIAELDITAYKHWNVQISEQWDTSASQSERTFVSLQFKPEAQSVVNVAYRYQRGALAPCIGSTVPLTPQEMALCAAGELPKDFTLQRTGLEQAEVSTAWPVSMSWNVLGRIVYALDAHEILDSFAGFEYRACCWGLRLLARRYVVNGLGQQDTGVLLQLELMGLASVGSAPDAFLGTAIRGYSRTTSIP